MGDIGSDAECHTYDSDTPEISPKYSDFRNASGSPSGYLIISRWRNKRLRAAAGNWWKPRPFRGPQRAPLLRSLGWLRRGARLSSGPPASAGPRSPRRPDFGVRGWGVAVAGV